MLKHLTYTINREQEGITVEEYLKNILRYSGRMIQKLTRRKGILLNNKSVFLQKKVKNGDVLNVLILEDQSYGATPEPGDIDILYQDNQVIVLNKPPRLLVHPTGKTTSGTLANFLAGYFQQKGEICTIRPLHRLDRDTSGCVIFAKDSPTQSMLEEQLHNGQLKRTYHAIVDGVIQPPNGIIDAPIGRHPLKPNRRAVNHQGEKAVTHYRTMISSGNLSLLELTLETGRTHQIRVHLAHIGHPVLGDRMYGRATYLISRQALHARSLSFFHPIQKKEIMVQAPLPSDMAGMVENISDS